jgi:hypothetical protein
MVGETIGFTEKWFTVRFPELLVLRSLATTRCSQHCAGDLSLDTAFVLIEGHPNSYQDLSSGPPAHVTYPRPG